MNNGLTTFPGELMGKPLHLDSVPQQVSSVLGVDDNFQEILPKYRCLGGKNGPTKSSFLTSFLDDSNAGTLQPCSEKQSPAG